MRVKVLHQFFGLVIIGLVDNINPLKPTESFDLGHVQLTPIDAAKRAETVYLDSALGSQAAPISFYPPVNTTPTN